MSELQYSFFDSLERRVRERPNEVALQSWLPGGGAVPYTWLRFRNEVCGLGAFLQARGIARGDRVAILMENHPRWGVAFAAIRSAGGIAVPLDGQMDVDTLTDLVIHSGARLVIASERYSANARQVAAAAAVQALTGDNGWEEMVQSAGTGGSLPLVDARLDDEIAILYTGGTTGKPKGVLLSERSLARSITDMLRILPLSPQDHILSVLPLFHIMPLLANLLAPLHTGARVTYLAQLDGASISKAFTELEITAFLCVPQFYYQIQRRILDEVSRRPAPARWLFRRLLRLSGLLRSTLGLRIGRRLFHMVHAGFGARLRALGVGGAHFNPDTARFFADLGFSLFQAYGLTECAGLATATPLGRNGGLSCGVPVAHADVKIFNPDCDGIGEIIVRGENLMRGYWRDEPATAAAIRDCWLHTGDLGTIAADGVLRITGRAKEVIVLSSGKNVFPEEVEELLLAGCPYIQEVCVAGVEYEDGARLHYLIVPGLEAFRDRGASRIEATIRAQVETLSRRLPAYKRPAAIHVLNEPLPRTTTRKLQRFRANELARRAANGAGAATDGRHAEPVDATEQAVIDVIRRFRPAGGPIYPSSSLELDLQMGSLERVELVAAVEAEFSTSLSDEEQTVILTVGDLAAAARAGGSVAALSASPRRNPDDLFIEPLTKDEQDLAAEYLRPRPVAEMFCYCGARIFRFAARILLRLRIESTASLPAGSFLLCANHTSYLDGLFAAASLPFSLFRRLFFFGASKYFRNPLLRRLGRRLRILPIDAEKNLVSALRLGRAGLQRGMILCVFPEGTRSFDGGLQPLMKGAAVLAHAAHVPAVPVGITGAFEILPRAGGFGGLHNVAVCLGEPLSPWPAESTDAFNTKLHSAMAAVLAEARKLARG